MSEVSVMRIRKLRTKLIQSLTEDDELVAQRWNQLIPVASQLFLENGFHATSTTELANGSGIPVGSLYRYISKKEDILLLVLDRIMDLYDAVVTPIGANLVDPFLSLVKSMESYYSIIDQNIDKVMLAYRETRSLDKIGRDYLKQREQETNAAFERLVEFGIQQGVFVQTHPGLMAYNIVSLGHMWASKIWYFDSRMTLREFTLEQCRFLMRGLLAPEHLHRIGELEHILSAD